ncbi:Triosephosphate isomerase [Candidatus Erwinia haradaeae]|uniref:Triosephosphate isomerase n=1 Tax=Candidatus Erwinia haradaeae TaxID=1922217 RepID=A0A451DCX6_9GAMM|nr:triose-phosphate isomerase [Candidatus Erwinia haradaeae]VFP84324.1 Triosephosphate isomerase [Candidatus Erwinia haradaeae]
MIHPLVIGNWKLNGNLHFISTMVSILRQSIGSIQNCKVVIAPPMIYLGQVKQAIYNSAIELCAQNVDLHISGAFTGEVSSNMLKDIGAKYVIIGHSERRLWHAETDYVIARKFYILKKEGLIPVLCIGETELEHQEGRTKEACARQIDVILSLQGAEAFNGVVIAYEPIWAIGTGKSAHPDKVQEVHEFIRTYIAQKDAKKDSFVTIQYGGSVTSKNIMGLCAQPDIDGVLVGSACLNPESFIDIIRLAVKQKSSKMF